MSGESFFWSRWSRFWMLAVFGGIVALWLIYRSWPPLTGEERFELGFAVMVVVGIAFNYLMHERELDKLREHVDALTRLRLSATALGMGMLGYLMAVMAHHR
jgi:hypothetical protein